MIPQSVFSLFRVTSQLSGSYLCFKEPVLSVALCGHQNYGSE
jgi:hypothetical protein